MNKIFLMALLAAMALPGLLQAQSPAYYGGEGDGYAEAELKAITLSLGEVPAAVRLQLYPNPVPAAGQLHISGDIQETLTIRLLDVSGRLVKEMTIKPSGSGQILSLSAEPGVYVLDVRSRSFHAAERVVFY